MSGTATFSSGRRTFLKFSASAALTAIFSCPAAAAMASENRVLAFYNVHTGETLKVRYYSGGKLIHRALQRINRIMRDHRTGESKPVDPLLLDVLHRLTSTIAPPSPINIISGYRSPSTNAALRKATSGVAANSLHMEGRAIDIRIPGCRTEAIRELAIYMQSGGVGYYPRSDFVHLDTGPFKVW